MFLLDDLMLAPAKGILWIFKEIHAAAEQELAGESDAITAALTELYVKLEAGQITEAEFDAQEKVLLDRLDHLEAQKEAAAAPEKKPSTKRRRRQKPALPPVTP